jgi:hypothetical protein
VIAMEKNYLYLHCQNTMEQHVFCILIDYRGRHRKGVAIYNAIYNKNLGFIGKKKILNTTEWLKQEKVYKLTLFLP